MTAADSRISVIGLGKLGLPLAACLASKGFAVAGIDTDERKAEKVNRQESPVFEPGLEDLLRRVGDRLSAGTDTAVVADTDVTFIVVGTPSEEDGSFSLRFVLPACEAIGRSIAAKDGYHLVVLTSTVMPGSTGGPVEAALEHASGKRCGGDFGLCYSPEFIALGSVIHDFLNPDFLLIGESDPRAGDLLASIYAQVCGAEVPTARLNFVNAEIAKLSVNAFVTTKISFANMLARLCERVSGADVEEVTAAIGLDSRIGARYLKGAISYGGPCFPRDNHALTAFAQSVGTPARLAETTDRVNREEIEALAEFVISRLAPGRRVGVLGLSYKPNTDVVEESPALLLVQSLRERGIDVVAYDPAALEAARRHLDEGVQFAPTAEACMRAADTVVLATPWEEFATLDPQLFDGERPRTLIDCWRLLDAERFASTFDYVALGRDLPSADRIEGLSSLGFSQV